MTIEIVLVILLVVQQLFWMAQIHKLINKLMSRDYTGYVYAQKKQPEKKAQGQTRIQLPDDEVGVLESFA
jgi:hypothetical protein